MAKPARNIFSLTRMLKSRRASPSSAMMKMCPPSSTGIGSRLSRPRFEADRRHQREERYPSLLRRLSRQLRDGERSHQLARRCLARDELADGHEDEPGRVVVPLDAHADRVDQARLDARDLFADADADATRARSSDGQRPVFASGTTVTSSGDAVAHDGHRHRRVRLLRHRGNQLLAQRDRRAVDSRMTSPTFSPAFLGRTRPAAALRRADACREALRYRRFRTSSVAPASP